MMMATPSPHPLDLQKTRYAYMERPNLATVALYEKHVAARTREPRVVDIGCGCGTNAAEFRKLTPGAYLVGIEPDPRAAELARPRFDDMFQGVVQDWLSKEQSPFDVVVMSDVLEHLADPVAFLRSVASAPQLRSAQWIISVPNYGVWHNRLRGLLGIQSYDWSGLWDRTHLRFFTRRTFSELLDYCGFDVLDAEYTPSLVHSATPVLRKAFEKDVAAGDHLALADSKVYGLYESFVEPIESRICGVWPSLLAFQNRPESLDSGEHAGERADRPGELLPARPRRGPPGLIAPLPFRPGSLRDAGSACKVRAPFHGTKEGEFTCVRLS